MRPVVRGPVVRGRIDEASNDPVAAFSALQTQFQRGQSVSKLDFFEFFSVKYSVGLFCLFAVDLSLLCVKMHS